MLENGLTRCWRSGTDGKAEITQTQDSLLEALRLKWLYELVVLLCVEPQEGD
jgi:hypothetical protein